MEWNGSSLAGSLNQSIWQALELRQKLTSGAEKNSLRGRTVLVVDEDANMVSILSTVLVDLGIDWALTAPTMRGAIELLATGRIECVILDWLKGAGQGLDLVTFIRSSSDSPNKELPIILCTAETTYDKVVLARDAGVTEVIAKPFSLGEVEAKLKAALNRKRPFVQSDEFFGPDRRRGDRNWEGDDRRGRKGNLLDQAEIDSLMDNLR